MSEQFPPPPPPPGGPTPPTPPGGPVPPSYDGTQPEPVWDLGQAVSWAWAKFQQNTTMIVGALILVVGIAVVEFGGIIVLAAITTTKHLVCDSAAFGCRFEGGTPWIVRQVLAGIVALVVFLVAQLIGAGLIRGSLGVAEGRPFDLSQLFDSTRFGQVVVTSVLSAVIVGIGYVLCFVPGIIAAFLLSYALYFVIDKDMEPVDALKASFELTTKNLGHTIIWFLVGGLIAVAGAIVCGIGIVVSLPITLLGTAYTFKKLTGQQVAA